MHTPPWCAAKAIDRHVAVSPECHAAISGALPTCRTGKVLAGSLYRRRHRGPRRADVSPAMRSRTALPAQGGVPERSLLVVLGRELADQIVSTVRRPSSERGREPSLRPSWLEMAAGLPEPGVGSVKSVADSKRCRQVAPCQGCGVPRPAVDHPPRGVRRSRSTNKPPPTPGLADTDKDRQRVRQIVEQGFFCADDRGNTAVAMASRTTNGVPNRRRRLANRYPASAATVTVGR